MRNLKPIGAPLPGWIQPRPPDDTMLIGQYCRLEPINADRHAALLYRAYDGDDALWTYMSYGPFSSAAQYHRWVREIEADPRHKFYAIHDLGGTCLGQASYLRIKPADGSIEVGNICFSPSLQGSLVATDAMVTMMTWAFEAGYRRYEWKCDALNRASRRAAQRLGFSFEGVFRQATVYKGRNRDTAWFSVIDTEWAALKEAFGFWLSPSNFDKQGQQKERLSDLTRLVRVQNDPVFENDT